MDSFLNDWKTYFNVGSVVISSVNCTPFKKNTSILIAKSTVYITLLNKSEPPPHNIVPLLSGRLSFLLPLYGLG